MTSSTEMMLLCQTGINLDFHSPSVFNLHSKLKYYVRWHRNGNLLTFSLDTLYEYFLGYAWVIDFI